MRSPRLTTITVAVGALIVANLVAAPGKAAATPTPGDISRPLTLNSLLTPKSRVTANKAASSALAETSPALLARKDAKLVPVAIKLDYDSVASYAGGIKGLAATSPRVTGSRLSDRPAAAAQYERYVTAKEAAVIDSLRAKVPSAKVGTRLRTVYGGLSATIPANAVKTVLSIPGVVAVQENDLRQPLTDSSPEFLNAPPVYDKLGTTANAGEGLIFGDIDTGVWPEHPSFADQGSLPPPGGPARKCEFGDNPLTPEADPFSCNNKLIGGAVFLDTYLAAPHPKEPFPDSARDSNGHGTHTASTAAGNVLESAKVLGVERGPLHGLAPGAYVSEYKVCGVLGCSAFDSAAAVQQAILDGVDVINYSISGGTTPFTDPVELAFLDAYAAGVFVSASAGNDGPTAGTANHLGPWVTTVAATTQPREFGSTLTLNASNGDTLTLDGASITAGVGEHPVVLAQSVSGYAGGAGCSTPAPTGVFDGMIVACQRDNSTARTAKGFNVLQGGAVAMVLYNPSLADVETDNHWLPTIHLPEGGSVFFPGPTLLGFMNSHSSVTGSFQAGEKRQGTGDVLAAFSSRGPAGTFLKPDVAAPGAQILAGNTPLAGDPAAGGGPAGEYFQAIAGTSMSAPHVAGAALLLKAAHPDWSPGQVKSALMTTATTNIAQEDGKTPAEPFDVGAGRIDIGAAATAPITFDESADDFAALGNDEQRAVHLNLPSINAPVMPGRLTTTRVATNVSNRQQRFAVQASAPNESTITVQPSQLDLKPGDSATLTITIQSDAPIGADRFGSIKLVGQNGSALHLPVAFKHTQGDVSVSQSCPEGAAPGEEATCTIEAVNKTFAQQQVDFDTTVSNGLRITGTDGAERVNARTARRHAVALAGSAPGVPAVAPGTSPGGYIPLEQFGAAPIPIGDEEILQFDSPRFAYNGQSWTRLAVDSNGYLIVGEAGPEDNVCCNLPAGPDAARPNNILAPFWADLDGTHAEGIRAASLTDGSNNWIVIEYQVKVFGTNIPEVFQIWIGEADDATPGQDIWYTYDPGNLPADPGIGFLVGAENLLGKGDVQRRLPTSDLHVTSTDATPGDTIRYTVDVVGSHPGDGEVTTEMSGRGLPGTAIAHSALTVTDMSWKSAMYGPGLDNNVIATTVWDDGNGPALYAAGLFVSAGGTAVNGIARWDGKRWSPLAGPSGAGMDAQVFALAVYRGELVAGGVFTRAGGQTVNGVARWDGKRWSPLAGPAGVGTNGAVQALAVYRGQLVAGGQFTRAGGVSANRIASWDGTRWSPLGSGAESGTVFALTEFEDTLIVGGNFLEIGGISVNRIARWDGAQWSTAGTGLGSSITDTVRALVVDQGALIAAGNFSRAGTTTVNNVARWDGSSWVALASGVSGGNNTVYALTVRDGTLIAGGSFTRTGDRTVNNVAQWDGIAWSALADPSGSSLDHEVRALTVYAGSLIAGGVFSRAGGVVVNRIASWDGAHWAPLAAGDAPGTGLNAEVSALATHNGALIAAGRFTVAGGTVANGIARWDGKTWAPLGAGFNDAVRTLTVYNGQLVAGGLFTQSDGKAVNRIARWDGTSWLPLGDGMNGAVDSLAVFNGKLIAGGRFRNADGALTNGIAAWDGAAWSPLGSGLGGPFTPQVWALTVYNGALIAGGVFATADGETVNNIARWDGSHWSGMGGPSGAGVDDRVAALTVFNGTLVAGGGFTKAGGVQANWIASWNGTRWAALGAPSLSGGCCGPFVRAVTVFDGALIAGGVFTQADGRSVNGIARWDGASWTPLLRPNSAGVSGGVNVTGGAASPGIAALAVCTAGPGPVRDTLVAGGSFALTGGVANWGLGFYGRSDPRGPRADGPC
ncbi:S8 family serine peptidase [Micromonospora sp. NPDC050200]|uniref:S8 family serine peptidase n=1 Tax=Micromonospora sp. NPDC050200 TaxID=3155664 RepID=UPI0033EDA66F